MSTKHKGWNLPHWVWVKDRRRKLICPKTADTLLLFFFLNFMITATRTTRSTKRSDFFFFYNIKISFIHLCKFILTSAHTIWYARVIIYINISNILYASEVTGIKININLRSNFLTWVFSHLNLSAFAISY